ncbi:hypothetical protein ACVWW2_002235 [Bradyrhizobium sp. LM4.3]
MRMVAHRIADPRILRLIELWLRAGVLESGEKQKADRGTPQGAGTSPLLANVFLHYVLDLGAYQWRRRHARGRIVTVRYADYFVMGFERKVDVQEMLLALRARLASFGLTLHEDKTRLIEFGRFAALSRQRRGERRPKTRPNGRATRPRSGNTHQSTSRSSFGQIVQPASGLDVWPGKDLSNSVRELVLMISHINAPIISKIEDLDFS